MNECRYSLSRNNIRYLIRTVAPPSIDSSGVVSVIVATTFTGEAARGVESVLAGVGPQKMHTAFPCGQYAIDPTGTSI